jgi:hypothetical protein
LKSLPKYARNFGSFLNQLRTSVLSIEKGTGALNVNKK